jgi:hypothetical protein
MAMALVIGLVIGVAIMYVMGRRGGSEPEVSWEDEPKDDPPPPPPEEPPKGEGGWSEF